MAKTHLDPLPVSGRPSDHRDGGGRVWRWVFFSGVAHAVLIAVLLIVPFLPSKAPNYPVYTVDLVGGEKLGGGAGTSVAPAPKAKSVPEVKASPEIKEAKKEAKKAKEEVRPNPAELKETKKKLPDSRAEMALAAKAKKEKEEAEAEKTREKLKELRERRIAEALEAIRSRAKSQEQREQQQQQKAAATSTATGKEPGAAALGAGGTGGGIARGAEFVRYFNEMRERIKSGWTWAGRRTDLVASVRFSIQENGEIVGLKLVRGSGDSSYDDSVIRALRKANPLPPPPESHREEFTDVELAFTPKELGG
ncbi:MAG TPA: cell envelope integrity protein TolA [Candidatus Binatia bacterium]|jgi:colicin import membrane protein